MNLLQHNNIWVYLLHTYIHMYVRTYLQTKCIHACLHFSIHHHWPCNETHITNEPDSWGNASHFNHKFTEYKNIYIVQKQTYQQTIDNINKATRTQKIKKITKTKIIPKVNCCTNNAATAKTYIQHNFHTKNHLVFFLVVNFAFFLLFVFSVLHFNLDFVGIKKNNIPFYCDIIFSQCSCVFLFCFFFVFSARLVFLFVIDFFASW